MTRLSNASGKGVRATRLLHSVHKWTGLVAGINVLILSVTGSWLVFDVEIARLFASPKEAVVLTIDPHGNAPIQAAIDGLVAQHPNAKPGIVFRAKHEEGIIELGFQGGDGPSRYQLDTVSGDVYPVSEGIAVQVNRFILILHDSLFLATSGILLLAVVAILFLVSTVTGIFIYGPFMKQALFGVIRRDRGARRYSAELHKLLGCLSLAFNVVIALTGIALTLGFTAVRSWFGPAIMLAAQGGMALPEGVPLPVVDTVIQRAAAAQPGLSFVSLSFPGPPQGANQFLCFFSKADSVTRSIPAPSFVPVVAEGEVRFMHIPLWVKATYLCIPFHFGDFAGLGMKVVYCIFGLSSGVLSLSGAILSFVAWANQWRAHRRAREAIPLGAVATSEGKDA